MDCSCSEGEDHAAPPAAIRAREPSFQDPEVPEVEDDRKPESAHVASILKKGLRQNWPEESVDAVQLKEQQERSVYVQE